MQYEQRTIAIVNAASGAFIAYTLCEKKSFSYMYKQYGTLSKLKEKKKKKKKKRDYIMLKTKSGFKNIAYPCCPAEEFLGCSWLLLMMTMLSHNFV